jgi:hypothetical protein
MMKRIYAVVNLIVVVAVIGWNYLSNTGKINGKTVGDVSDKLDNLFTPAGYAFAIWGIIFLGLLVNGIYQVKVAYGNDTTKQANVLTGPWLIIANIANGVWIWFWLNGHTGLSVFTMIIILLALIKVALQLRLENYGAPRDVIIFGWWSNTIYLGWISVALIANVAAYLSKIGWADKVNEVYYTILMLIVATLVNLFVLYTRNMREFCLVGIWALVAIAKRSEIESIYNTAIACVAVLVILTLVHGFRNLKDNTLFSWAKQEN